MDKRERNDIFRVLDEETLKNSKKDVRSRSFLFPKRILWTAGQVENSRRLLEKEEMQISLAAHKPCILKDPWRNLSSGLAGQHQKRGKGPGPLRGIRSGGHE